MRRVLDLRVPDARIVEGREQRREQRDGARQFGDEAAAPAVERGEREDRADREIGPRDAEDHARNWAPQRSRKRGDDRRDVGVGLGVRQRRCVALQERRAARGSCGPRRPARRDTRRRPRRCAGRRLRSSRARVRRSPAVTAAGTTIARSRATPGKRDGARYVCKRCAGSAAVRARPDIDARRQLVCGERGADRARRSARSPRPSTSTAALLPGCRPAERRFRDLAVEAGQRAYERERLAFEAQEAGVPPGGFARPRRREEPGGHRRLERRIAVREDVAEREVAERPSDS